MSLQECRGRISFDINVHKIQTDYHMISTDPHMLYTKIPLEGEMIVLMQNNTKDITVVTNVNVVGLQKVLQDSWVL